MVMSYDGQDNPKDRIKQIVKQFAGTLSADDTSELVPEYGIKGTGYIFCFYPAKKMFIKISRGSKAFIVDEELNIFGRVLIYTFNGEMVEIDPDELEYTGFD